MLICQVAKEKYLVDRIIARVNNPRNKEWFDLLEVRPARLGHRPDPAADRARGPRVRAHPPARPARGAPRDHRDAARQGLAGRRAAGRRPVAARGQPADLGAARRDAASSPAPTRCSSPATRSSPSSTRASRRTSSASSGPTGPSPRWARFERARRSTSCSSAAASRRPLRRRAAKARGGGRDPARRARARAALRAPAAVEGVPARRGEARGRLRQRAVVVRGERRRAPQRDERDVARRRGAHREAPGRRRGLVRQGADRHRRERQHPAARGRRARGHPLPARVRQLRLDPRRRRGGRARRPDRRQLHRLRGRRVADREGHEAARS